MRRKEILKKFIVFLLSGVGVISVVHFLDIISDGNIIGVGIGTYLLSIVGLWNICESLHKIIFKEKK
jgi:hypothetical protein